MASAFQLSYDDLAPEQQQLFRSLGLHPGTDIDSYAAAALDGGPVDTTADRLDALYTDNLVDELLPGRYHCHDLIREYARALTRDDPAEDNDLALDRLLGYYLHCATSSRLATTRPSRGQGTSTASYRSSPGSAPRP